MNSFQGMLKEKEAEFYKTAGIIKSKTAVYVGRLNKLEEFLEQEEMLEQKYEEIKEDIARRKEIHQKRLNDMEYSYLHSKTVIKRDKIKQAVDFGMEIRRKIFIESDPVMDRVLQENNEIMKNLQVYQTTVTKINQEFKAENEKLQHLHGVGKSLQMDSAELMIKKGRINCELDELRQSIKVMKDKIETIEPNLLRYQQMMKRSEKLEKQTKLALYNDRLRKQDMHASKVELYALQTSNIEYKEYNLKAETLFLDTLATIKKEFYKVT
ncbi:uncharacterized protein LOC126837872 [Adelges cooleyi]|uniref:uncharacterized protein LOC126837872 n=1 Tax=Adelges cooleyi TaxID=133065 RepID=UPI0021808E8D|nr:uncharacterized protein LOC126837872 [Adelges cooleyi]